MLGALPCLPVLYNFKGQGLKSGGEPVRDAFPHYRFALFRGVGGLGELRCRTARHRPAGAEPADGRGNRA